MARWEEVVGKCSLRHLDVSHNQLGDEGAIKLIKGLLEGPLRTKAEERRNPHKAGLRRTPRLRHLVMRNVGMGDEAGLVLTQLVSQNRKVQRVQIEGNTINYKYVEEVNEACARNRQLAKQGVVPKCLQELSELIQST